MSPVTTTVLTKMRSRSSVSLRDRSANGPLSPHSVYQSAMAQIAALVVVTSRWPKRNAAQTMNGTITNVRPKPPLNTTSPAANSSTAKISASASLCLGQAMPGTVQLSTSGAKISMPQASPCHQVHQLDARSGRCSG